LFPDRAERLGGRGGSVAAAQSGEIMYCRSALGVEVVAACVLMLLYQKFDTVYPTRNR
jgi:hypothetical protein